MKKGSITALLLAAAIGCVPLAAHADEVQNFTPEMLTVTQDSADKTVSVAVSYVVEAIDISNATISLEPEEFIYSGEPNEPALTVTMKINDETVTLVKDQDYTVTYRNNVNPSTKDNPSLVEITGIGYYTGTASAAFTVREQEKESSSSQSA